MSRPEDRSTRGLLYLIAWFTVAPFAFAALGGAILALPGLTLGLVTSVALGLWGFNAYIQHRPAARGER